MPSANLHALFSETPHEAPQPYRYAGGADLVEPDWRRLPGYRDVTREEWESAKWQRLHTVKNLDGLARVFGDHLPPALLESIRRDQSERATMSMLVPPQMLNTMDERDLWGDPIRHYMIPAFEDREKEWPSHPTPNGIRCTKPTCGRSRA
jgi:lysine 2,3-aminomutase